MIDEDEYPDLGFVIDLDEMHVYVVDQCGKYRLKIEGIKVKNLNFLLTSLSKHHVVNKILFMLFAVLNIIHMLDKSKQTQT